MFIDAKSVSLLLLGLVFVGLAIVVLMDFLRGKKIRLEIVPAKKPDDYSSPRGQVIRAVLFLLYAVFLAADQFLEYHRPLRTRPVGIFLVVVAAALFFFALIDLFHVVREQRRRRQLLAGGTAGH